MRSQGDFFDLFDEDRAFSSGIFQSYRKVSNEFIQKWWVRNGFDSGLFAINKDLRHAEIQFLARIASKISKGSESKAGPGWKKTSRRGWTSLSMGDKDLWKLSLIARFINYTMVPYVGALGSFNSAGRKFSLTSQLKHNRQGKVIALHQLHRDNSFPPGLYNEPSVEIAVDLRKPGQWFDFGGFKLGESYARVSTMLGPSQMKSPPSDVLASAQEMSQAWGYNKETTIETIEKIELPSHQEGNAKIIKAAVLRAKHRRQERFERQQKLLKSSYVVQ